MDEAGRAELAKIIGRERKALERLEHTVHEGRHYLQQVVQELPERGRALNGLAQVAEGHPDEAAVLYDAGTQVDAASRELRRLAQAVEEQAERLSAVLERLHTREKLLRGEGVVR